MLLAGYREDEARIIDGREQTVSEASAIERQHLLPMARESFDLVEVSFGQGEWAGLYKGADQRLFGAAPAGCQSPKSGSPRPA